MRKNCLKRLLCLFLPVWLALPAFAVSTAEAAFSDGLKLQADRDYFGAIEQFKASAQDPYFPLIDYSYYYIGQCYQSGQNPDLALQVNDIVIDFFKNSVLVPKALYTKAEIYQAQQDWPLAVKYYRLFLAQHADHDWAAAANFHLAECLEKQGNYVEAARSYRNVDMNYHDDPFAVKALERLDELGKQKAVANYEARAATIYNLGIRHFQDGDMAGAKGYFNRLAEDYSKSSFYDDAVLMLGRVALRQGKLARAEKYFRRAINLGRDSKSEAMYYLARTYFYQESPEAGLTQLKKVVELFPRSYWAAESLIYLGQHYEREKEADQALAAYEALSGYTLTPYQQSQASWNAGQIYFRQEKYPQALQEFKLAYQAAPDNAPDKQLFWLAKSADKAGLRDEAIAGYKKTIVAQDHSYYGYRAREELKRFGHYYSPQTVPDAKETLIRFSGLSYDLSSHEQKYNLLLAFDLGDEAAEEAGFIETRISTGERDNASLAKYHAYIAKGKFAKPIDFADKKINNAVRAGGLDRLDPRLWRFAYPRGYWQYVEKYAKEYNLEPALVYAVIREESRFRPQALSRSRAHGLMQIMPGTGRLIADALGLRYSRWNMFQPGVNIQMGCYYLSQTIRRFDGNVPLALAGYNGGPNRVSRWLKEVNDFDLDEFVESIPISETRNYVKKVMKSYYGYKRVYSNGG